MSLLTRPVAATLVVLLCPATAPAQPQVSSDSSKTISVPRLISISGVYRPADRGQSGGVETVTLAVYGEETGGTPLWQETQSIAVDTSGRYTLLLGTTEAAGIPLAVFASGDARWLEMTWARAGDSEGPRTRLTSVPYAFKASDADTLGGRPASEYLLSPSTRSQTTDPATSGDAIAPDVFPGSPGSLAKYQGSTDLVPSSVFETPGRLGVNTTAPLDIIHSRFTNTTGGLTGFAVQNLGNTAASYSGMLFYDQHGALGQFQGFNNLTHEYRINNIASGGSINFMLGSASRFLVDSIGVAVSAPMDIFTGNVPIGVFVDSAGPTGIGVGNIHSEGVAVYGLAVGTDGWGVLGDTNTGVGIFGYTDDVVAGWAGFFDGDVNVLGTLFKGGGAFRIDHPLDPQNKYLSHSFVESPDMKNIYDGVAVLDQTGEATVTLPNWFEALNGNFRYQLTPMGAAFVPYVADEIAANKFKIAGGMPGKKVSWQVTGIRHDAFANANRIQVEELKSGAAAGTYLHPEAFGLVRDKGQSKATANDPKARQEQMKARLRAISHKPSKK